MFKWFQWQHVSDLAVCKYNMKCRIKRGIVPYGEWQPLNKNTDRIILEGKIKGGRQVVVSVSSGNLTLDGHPGREIVDPLQPTFIMEMYLIDWKVTSIPTLGLNVWWFQLYCCINKFTPRLTFEHWQWKQEMQGLLIEKVLNPYFQ